jgi:hypothetical protein
MIDRMHHRHQLAKAIFCGPDGELTRAGANGCAAWRATITSKAAPMPAIATRCLQRGKAHALALEILNSTHHRRGTAWGAHQDGKGNG